MTTQTEPLGSEHLASDPYSNAISTPEGVEAQETSPMETLIDSVEIVVEENVDPLSGPMSIPKLLTQWMNFVAPYFKQGGKPSSLILTLGAVAIPLTVPVLLGYTGGVPVILAIAAGIVAIRACLQP